MCLFMEYSLKIRCRDSAIVDTKCNKAAICRLALRLALERISGKAERLAVGPVADRHSAWPCPRAWRRNHCSRTLICDLERHRTIALLPDREPATDQAWRALQAQICVVARDRGGGICGRDAASDF